MIKVVWFCACMGDWRAIAAEQVDLLHTSGLVDAADELLVCQAGDGDLASMLTPKFSIVARSRLNQYEFPGLRLVRSAAQEGDQVLYLHTKGASKAGKYAEYAARWREYMHWGCVERWRDNLDALSGHDVSGVQLTRLSKQFVKNCGAVRLYAGNFWWARGGWVRALPEPADNENRWLAEGWIMGDGRGRYADLHNLTGGDPVTDRIPFGARGFTRAAYDPQAARLSPPLIESRHHIINALIRKFGYRRYLEIGVERFNCFRHVRCALKECVDPAVPEATHVMTSDAFFASDTRPWDIVFIDGLHTEAQVLRDVEHALARLAPGGALVLHDCDPQTEYEQRNIPQYDGKGVWVGTVWRAWARLRMTRPDLAMHMIDTDFGCGVIRRGSQETYPEGALSFPALVRDRQRLMNVVEPEDFQRWLHGMSRS